MLWLPRISGRTTHEQTLCWPDYPSPTIGKILWPQSWKIRLLLGHDHSNNKFQYNNEYIHPVVHTYWWEITEFPATLQKESKNCWKKIKGHCAAMLLCYQVFLLARFQLGIPTSCDHLWRNKHPVKVCLWLFAVTKSWLHHGHQACTMRRESLPIWNLSATKWQLYELSCCTKSITRLPFKYKIRADEGQPGQGLVKGHPA